MAFSITARSLVQTGLVMSAGDLGAQYLEHHRQLERKQTPSVLSIDQTRLVQMTALGMAMNGVCVPLWLKIIWKRIPGRHFDAVAKKLVLDQVIYAPFMLVVVLAYTSTMKEINSSTTSGTNHERVLSIKRDLSENLQEKGWEIFLTDCCVWPWASLFNFMYIPKRSMVLYYSVISVGWNTYLSYTSWKALESKDEILEPPES